MGIFIVRVCFRADVAFSAKSQIFFYARKATRAGFALPGTGPPTLGEVPDQEPASPSAQFELLPTTYVPNV